MAESSGASCPGLIEAPDGPELPAPERRGHPGLLAPASLKQIDVGHGMDQNCPSSGASCPGLIEAVQASVSRIALVSCHPGLLAPASLKR